MDRFATDDLAPATDASSAQLSPYLAALRFLMPDAASTSWLLACYQLTARVERVSASQVLLDLGHCTPEEALLAIQSLLTRISELSPALRVGIAPSLTLAQLALAQTTHAQPMWLLTPAEALTFLRRLPVEMLAGVHPQGLITPETVQRLQQYGLRTLGQVARLGVPALRRQFGPKVGGALGTIAIGRDPRPLCPTPVSPSLALRLRVPDGALPPTQTASLLPLFAAQASTLLHQARVQTQALRLVARWEPGGRTEASTVLPQPTADVTPLRQALHRLFQHLVETYWEPHQAHPQEPFSPMIAGLRLTLAELRPLQPAQGTFWRTRAQTLAATARVAETLTIRYGQVLLTRPRLAVPAAIFPEERYVLGTPETPPDVADGAVSTPK